MILETIITTRNDDGSINVAPMGPHCDEDQLEDLPTFELRPFTSSTTLQNLRRLGQGVLHITDDVLVYAQSAIGQQPDDLSMQSAEKIDGMFLTGCCRCFEFQVKHLDESSNRASIQCETVYRHRLREFTGFNRARHSVLEACILATRLDFIPVAEIQNRLVELKTLIERTGGSRELQAFQLLSDYVDHHSKPENAKSN